MLCHKPVLLYMVDVQIQQNHDFVQIELLDLNWNSSTAGPPCLYK